MWNDLWETQEPTAAEPQRVLVAIVPDLASWERVCNEGWYRIPLSRAPRRIGAEYLAFYHPKCFEALRWTIRYYAPIERYSLVSRRELLPEEPEHPRAEDLYYKLELGPLHSLARPIPSRNLRRVTFIQTDLATLLQASEIRDLWRRQKPKERLWNGTQLSEARIRYNLEAA